MNDGAPKKQTKPEMKRIDGPPKPPTRVTLGLDELGGPPRENHPFIEMATALTHAQTTWCELLVLNGGGRQLKRESLELSLDRNIILLSKAFPKLEEKQQNKFQKIVTDTLRNIRDYRLQHPRTDASNPEQAEQARRILDGIPKA